MKQSPEYECRSQCGACEISDGIFKDHPEVSNVTEIFFTFICWS